MNQIILPHNWRPRPYQLPYWNALESGIKRAVHVWHRRAGKDLVDFNWSVTQAFERKGVYWHVLPQYNQARKAIWEASTRDGRSYIDHIPPQLIARRNNQEMMIEFVNGSIWRLIGSDAVNKIVGAGPVGVVMSEYSLQNPLAWDYIQPMLMENDGWAVFNFTPRGENHAFDLFNMAMENPKWYAEKLTIEDTDVVTLEQIDELRAEGKDEDHILQEYYCSFEGSITGAYYSQQMKDAKAQGRITAVPYEPSLLVNTAWDLGMADSMAIWFFQQYPGGKVAIIDYYENSGEGLPHYKQVLNDKRYAYGRHIGPHDLKVRELGTGQSRLEMAENLGIRFELAPNIPKLDGINAARSFIPKCWFDAEKCHHGINALRQYRKEWDEDRQVFKQHPLHDWSSHGADAFRYLAVGYFEEIDFSSLPDRAEGVDLHSAFTRY